MAIKPLNSVAGFSVGQVPANVILGNGDIFTNNITVNNFANLGNVGNVYIGGGTNGYVLQTNGSGNLSWVSPGSPSAITNGNSNVEIPTSSGNIYLNANAGVDKQWIFDTTGNLTGPAAGSANLGNSVYANFFIGSGNNLSNIQASNVSGEIGNANYATYSGTAYSVSGANVSGEVANANYATYSGTAYSVSGANVSGEVANANYATYSGTAYSVSGANVSGEVANANYATYSGTAYSVSGANVSGEVANANYATYSGSADTAGTVTTAAQPNITSVGTLSDLSVSGTITTGNINTTGSGGDITLTGGNIAGGNVVVANSFTSNGGVVDFSTNNPNVSLGNVSNVHIGGGSNGYILTTDGTGNLSWNATASTTNIYNGNSNVTIPVADGNVYINANASVDKQWVFDVNGNTTFPATGAANLGNLVTVNYANITNDLVVQGNIANANNISITNTLKTNLEQLTSATATHIIYANGSSYLVGDGAFTFNDTNKTLSVGNANITTALNVGANITIGAGGTSNISGVNYVSANVVTATGNITGANIITTGLANVGTLTVTGNANTGNLGTNNFIATGTGSFGGNVNMNTYWINNVGYPNLATDAATKSYVDTMVSSGISYHQPVYAATTTTLASATGGTVTYNNGTAGIGANLTTTGSFNLIDTANVQTVGTRILVKNEANAAWNGIYEYTSATVITRTADADQYGPDSTEELSINDFFFTTAGAVNKGTAFIVSGPAGTITFGTSNITFSIFTTSAVYTAGTGLTLAPNNEFSISNTAVTAGSYGNGDSIATFTVNDQGQLTAASNVVSAANAANLSGTTLATGIVTSSLTAVGTLANLSVFGNANVGNIGTAGLVTASGNITGANINTGGIVSATGNVSGGNISTGGLITATGNITGGNLITTGAANIGNLSISGVVIGDLIPAVNVTQNLGNSTNKWKDLWLSGSTIQLGDQSIQSNAAGIILSNILFVTDLVASNNISTVTLTASGNVTGANIATGGLITVTGNANVGNIGTAGLITATGNITGGNLITSGLITVTGNANIGNIGTAGIITATGNIDGGNLGTAGLLTVTGNANIGNIGTAGLVTATGNITGGNLITSGLITVTGNANIGNIGTAGVVLATGNITGANVTANSYVFAPAIVSNASTYDTRVSLNSAAGIVEITSNGNSTQFNPSGQITLQGASQIVGGTFAGSQLQLDTTQTNLKQIRGGNVTVQVGTGGSTTDTWTFANSGNTTFPANGTVNLGNTAATLGNTAIRWGTLTTSTITANQTIATLSVTGVTGIEFLVKGIDSGGEKYSIATVQAVTDGANVDYSTFGGVQLGGYTGSLAVNIDGSNISLQVTPASSNSTVWTTQYRVI
jgi:hypothetical protein